MPREYTDADHEVMNDYYDILESYTGRNRKTTKSKLGRLITRDPDFFDSYIRLAQFLQEEGNEEEARRLVDEAYERAIRRITSKRGKWPDVLEWSWLENRHIIRTLLHKGIQFWQDGKTEDALDLFRKVLHTNPNDNPGIRYYILAIREGMSFEEFEHRFNKGGYYTEELNEWFIADIKKYPDEFNWWEKEVEKYW